MAERLNKVLAQAGITSRRGADEMILAGRISVNGKPVTEMGMKVDPAVDDIRLDGERIASRPASLRYIVLYKPRNVITTAFDPFDRPTVMDFVDPSVRLFPVGRLDGNSEGLIILTNDGELANQLTHPRYEHEKEYRVKISGTPTDKTLQTWREGVWLDDGRTLPAKVTVDSSTGPSTWLRFVLREGKNRQVRRMVETLHHTVLMLIRTRMGPITLGDLKPGEWRYLSKQELDALQAGSNEPILYGKAAEAAVAEAEERKKGQYKEGWARPKRDKNQRPGKSSRPRFGGRQEQNRSRPNDSGRPSTSERGRGVKSDRKPKGNSERGDRRGGTRRPD